MRKVLAIAFAAIMALSATTVYGAVEHNAQDDCTQKIVQIAPSFIIRDRVHE